MAGRTRPFLFYRSFRKRSRSRVAALTATTAVVAARLHELRCVGFAPGRAAVTALILTTLAVAMFARAMFARAMFG
jgi:hypothetical protein